MNLMILRRRAPKGTSLYLDRLNQDFALHGFIVLYALVGVPHKFTPFTYASMVSLPEMFALLVAGIGLWSLRSSTPLKVFRAHMGAVFFGPHAVAGFLLFVNLLIFMGVFTSMKSMLTDLVPFHADRFLADLDVLLHGKDPWLYTAALLPPWLTPALEVLYFGAWGLLLPAATLTVLLVPKLRPIRAQYLWTSVIAWTLLGNVIAAAAMSAGPVFYDRVVGDARFEGLVAHLAQHSSFQEWARDYLWKFHISGESGAGAAISAFPSMHLANATLLFLLARHVHKWAAIAAGTFCGLILFGSVYLGWHYAVDGYFSIAATVLIWRWAGWATRRSRTQPTTVARLPAAKGCTGHAN